MLFPWLDKPEKLKDTLLQLTSDARPIWGRMDAQQMIETFNSCVSNFRVMINRPLF